MGRNRSYSIFWPFVITAVIFAIFTYVARDAVYSLDKAGLRAERGEIFGQDDYWGKKARHEPIPCA